MPIFPLPTSAPLNPGRLSEMSFQVIANPDASIPTLVVPKIPLALVGVRVLFDLISTPNSLSFPINSLDGISVVASQTLAASGPGVLPLSFVPFEGMSIPFTGNTTPGGIFTITLSVIAF